MLSQSQKSNYGQVSFVGQNGEIQGLDGEVLSETAEDIPLQKGARVGSKTP